MSGTIEAKTLRSEQYEFEARSTDPANAEPGEYWIRTDQTSSSPDVVAELRRQNTSGVTKIPLFGDSEESNLGSKMVRGPSVVLDNGSVGFVAMTTDSGAAFGSPRAVTSGGVEYLSHNALKLSTLPDSGLLHDYDAQSQSFSNRGSISTLVDQQGSKDLSGNATGNASGINGLESFEYDGIDDEHTDGSGASLGPNGEYTIAIVFEFIDLQGGTDTRFLSNGKQPDVFESSSWNWNHAGKSGNDGGTADTNAHIIVASYDGSNLVVDVDDTRIINNSNVGIGTPSNYAIGSQGGNFYANILIGQVLHYDIFYDNAGRTDIYNSLSIKWGF